MEHTENEMELKHQNFLRVVARNLRVYKWFLEVKISQLAVQRNSDNLATIKRKRGRPRRVELRGDFDTDLIREFEKRPELYNRSLASFKDKAYLDELWEDLSHSLGYESNIVKDRMLQLRNRYHIEKRRIENLQKESPKRQVESNWPLYEQLSFLSEHIPVRRSFRNMNCKRTYEEFSVKNEQGSDVESEGDQRHDTEYLPGNRKSSIQVRNFGSLIPTKMENDFTQRSHHPQQGVASNAYSQAPPRLTRFPRNVQVSSRPIQLAPQRPTVPLQQSPQRLPTGADKFHAFGRFLTSSLIELPEDDALVLVNKFTTELVNSCLKKHDPIQIQTHDQRADHIQIQPHDHRTDRIQIHPHVQHAEMYMETNGHGDELQE